MNLTADITIDVTPDLTPDITIDITIDTEPGPQDPARAADGEHALSSFARCADGFGTLSHLFFSDEDLELARAKAICRTCGLQDDCLSGAIARAEPYGVWGGMLVVDGVPVEFKRKRGRPPKRPVPALVVDETPIPAHLLAPSVA